MKNVGTVVTFAIFFGTLGVLSLFLLVTTHYFSTRELADVHFGLTGAEISGSFESYELLIDNCSENHKLSEYCDNLPSFNKAGLFLTVILSLDILLLCLFLLNIFLARIMIKRLIEKTLQGVQTSQMCLTKVQVFFRNLIFVHPLLILGGAITWVSVCDLGHIPGHIDLEEGVLVLLANAFISLLVTACYFHFLRNTKEANKKLFSKRFKQVI